MNETKMMYIKPSVEVYELLPERGFALSDSGTIEDIEGRDEDQGW